MDFSSITYQFDGTERTAFEKQIGQTLERFIESLLTGVDIGQLEMGSIQTIELHKGRHQKAPQTYGLSLITNDYSKTGLRYTFDFEKHIASMHIAVAKDTKHAANQQPGLGSNQFWMLADNFRRQLPGIGMKHLHLEVENSLWFGALSRPKVALGMFARAGVEMKLRLDEHERFISKAVQDMLNFNYTQLESVMNDAEKAQFQDAMRDPKHIDVQAIALLDKRIYLDYNHGPNKFREAAMTDRSDKERSKNIFTLGDLLLNGLVGSAVLDLEKPLPEKLVRIFSRVDSFRNR